MQTWKFNIGQLVLLNEKYTNRSEPKYGEIGRIIGRYTGWLDDNDPEQNVYVVKFESGDVFDGFYEHQLQRYDEHRHAERTK